MHIKLSLSVILLTFASSNLYADNSIPRWYSAQQETEGKLVFQKNCSVCHGNKAEATLNWKQPDANGQYPPPPLDGTAHAWHHSLDILRQSIRDGGTKIGGLMPAFEKVLKPQDMDKAIAYFQSQWSDELYAKWSKNFNVEPLKQVAPNKAAKNPVLKRLIERLNAPEIESINNVANGQLYEVKTKGKIIYLTKDGRFAVLGQLIDLETGKNLSQ